MHASVRLTTVVWLEVYQFYSCEEARIYLRAKYVSVALRRSCLRIRFASTLSMYALVAASSAVCQSAFVLALCKVVMSEVSSSPFLEVSEQVNLDVAAC